MTTSLYISCGGGEIYSGSICGVWADVLFFSCGELLHRSLCSRIRPYMTLYDLI